MGHNDFEQSVCLKHPHMNFNQSLALISQFVRDKWLPFLVDYYHMNSCSTDETANNSRCCFIAHMILMDQVFECDIRRIFDAF